MIFEFCDCQYWNICWHYLCSCSNQNYIFYFLQIVNNLVVLFWRLCVLDKLRHCFLNLKWHLKIIKTIIIIALDINAITIDIFIIISILYIITKLTELHELTLIVSFLLILKFHMGKSKLYFNIIVSIKSKFLANWVIGRT